jgi:hypothetical protein
MRCVAMMILRPLTQQRAGVYVTLAVLIRREYFTFSCLTNQVEETFFRRNVHVDFIADFL